MRKVRARVMAETPLVYPAPCTGTHVLGGSASDPIVLAMHMLRKPAAAWRERTPDNARPVASVAAILQCPDSDRLERLEVYDLGGFGSDKMHAHNLGSFRPHRALGIGRPRTWQPAWRQTFAGQPAALRGWQAVVDAVAGSREITNVFSVCPLCACVPGAWVV
jgi:hypothetical protein